MKEFKWVLKIEDYLWKNGADENEYFLKWKNVQEIATNRERRWMPPSKNIIIQAITLTRRNKVESKDCQATELVQYI